MRYFKLAVSATVGLFLVTLVTSCTKPTASTVRIEMPDVESMTSSGKYLSHVVISITSGGSPLARHVWDNDNENQPAPSEFALTVPAGPDRLIQYMEVWDDLTTNKMEFYYGDVSRALEPGDVNVELRVDPYLANNGQTAEVRLKGRYFDGQGNTPTGPVEWFIVPRNGKPPMYVEDTFIYGGWMDFMVFDNVPILFKMKGGSGLPLFLNGAGSSPEVTGAKLSDIVDLAVDPARLLRMRLPQDIYEYRTIGEDYLCVGVPSDAPREMYFGYYGKVPADQKVYYDSYFSSIGSIYSDNTCYTNQSTSLVRGGGVASSEGCEDKPLCLDYYSYPLTYQAGVFNIGPFKTSSLRFTDGTTEHIHWTVLAGANQKLEDFLLFYGASLPNGDGMDDDLLLMEKGCEEFLLSKGLARFRPNGTILPPIKRSDGVENTTTKEWDYSLEVSVPSQSIFAVCPRFNFGGKVVPAPEFGIITTY